MILSPITQRRLSLFKANKRGFYSFWLFIALFVICIGSEFIANDKPLLVHYDGGYYFPIINDYAETTNKMGAKKVSNGSNMVRNGLNTDALVF